MAAPKGGPEPAAFIRSALRIFLSVDVVGSTAFKQGGVRAAHLQKAEAGGAPAEPWFPPIVEFYREIDRHFSTEWDRYKNGIAAKHGWPTGKDPEFWKGLGDEVIYVKELSDYREALGCVHAWRAAINKYREIFRGKFPNLSLKTTAWIAGFPVHNAEVVVRSSVSAKVEYEDDDDPIFSNMALMKAVSDKRAQSDYLRDYIGPSIDIGFRLCALATPRKLVVSVDLALMLIYATRAQPGDFGFPKLSFRYDGGVQLRGVFGDAPYPVFWVDMMPDDAVNRAEDRLLDKDEIDSDRVLSFCEAFIDANPNFVFRPYIVGGSEPYFDKIPPRHEERLKKLREYWEEELERRKIEEESQLSSEAKAPGKIKTQTATQLAQSTEEALKSLRELFERWRKK